MDQRPNTIKLEEDIGRTLFDINHRHVFLDPPQRNEKKNKQMGPN